MQTDPNAIIGAQPGLPFGQAQQMASQFNQQDMARRQAAFGGQGADPAAYARQQELIDQQQQQRNAIAAKTAGYYGNPGGQGVPPQILQQLAQASQSPFASMGGRSSGMGGTVQGQNSALLAALGG